MVTEECLLDPSRNPHLDKDGIENVRSHLASGSLPICAAVVAIDASGSCVNEGVLLRISSYLLPSTAGRGPGMSLQRCPNFMPGYKCSSAVDTPLFDYPVVASASCGHLRGCHCGRRC